MTFDTFRTLFGTTLTNPRQGGREVIDLNLPTRGLWIALMLMAVVLSLLVSGLFHVSPMPPDELGQMIRMSPAFQAPLIFAVINWGQSVITVFVLHWISQMVGGDGRLRDMLSVMIWLQVMTLVLAVSFFLVAMVIPAIGGLFMLLAFFWGLWAMVAFVDAASDFDSMFRALGVCIAALLVFSFGTTVFSALIGGLAYGGFGSA